MRLRLGAALLALMILAIALIFYSAGSPNPASIAHALVNRDPADPLDAIARKIRSAPSEGEPSSIGAALTAAGHWRLVNRDGEQLTASSADEIVRALATLAPESHERRDQAHIVVDAKSLFGHSKALRQWPPDIRLSVLIGGRQFPIMRSDRAGAREQIVLRPGLLVEASSSDAVLEVLGQVERPLDRSSVRMLALEPGGATRLARAPMREPGARYAQPDVVDPTDLDSAFASVSGQIVLLSGRLEPDKLIYHPGSGPTGEVTLESLEASVVSSDANLVVLDATSARQPGTRNWLWQRIALTRIDKAVGRATLGDFLHALAGEPETLTIKAATPDHDRIDLLIEPLVSDRSAPIAGLTRMVAGTWSNIVSETAGTVSVRALRASLLTVERQRELDRRFVLGVPYAAQMGYLILVMVGLLAFPVIREWWCRIWPPEIADDYGSRTGEVLASVVRGLVLALIFCPLAAVPAILLHISRLIDKARSTRRGLAS